MLDRFAWPARAVSRSQTLLAPLGILLGTLLIANIAAAQSVRVRLPESTDFAALAQDPSGVTADPYGGTAPPPLTQGGNPAPPNVLGPPQWDPFSTAPSNAADIAPSLQTPPSAYGTPPGTANPWGTPPSYPPGTFPSQAPPSVFPNGMWGPNATMPNWAPPLKFIQGPRVRYTWVNGGSDDRSLGTNDFDLSASMAFPDFLYSGQPIFIAPSFTLSLWDGPQPPNPGDLPSKGYGAYIDAGWSTNPVKPVGVEVGVRVGVFSDFETLTQDSLRIQGQGIFRIQMTPRVSLKGGVIYADRADTKMLPAGGILWLPSPQKRWDIFFPRGKIACYLTTLGNYDVWWYLGGEYGGGSWTVVRTNGDRDRFDINDIRLIGGIEWGQQNLMRKGQRIGFIEAGWVTEREIIYVVNPDDNSTFRDSVMVRAGFGY